MSETHTIAKIVIVIGLTFLLIGALNPGAEAAWNTFSASIQAFPIFDNPFSSQRGNFTLIPTDDGSVFVPPASVTDNDAIAFCDTSATPASNWWGCLITKDANTSYASTELVDNQFRVGLGEFLFASSNFPILSATVKTQCRATGGSPVITNVQFSFPAAPFLNGLTCKPGNFANETLFQEFASGPYPTIASFSGVDLLFLSNPPGLVDFSYVEVTFTYTTAVECSGADTLTYIGCILTSFFNFIINSVRLIVNSLVFLGQILAYLVGIIVSFIALFAFFLTIPGAPAIIQGIFTVIIVSLIGFIIIFILSKARGSGAMG